MNKKITFISYQNESEFIITTPELEAQTLKEYFVNPSDRDIEDYERQEHFEEAITIEPSMKVRWG
jgi:hypothetical protein